VNPSSEPEQRGFDDQFQHDGHGWLFRRFHRARPVRVTAEEMDQSISFFERWSGRWSSFLIGVGIIGSALWAFFGPDNFTWADRRFHGLALVALLAIGWLGRRWLWFKATERFNRRVPVGLGQSWLEDRQSLAVERDWSDLLAPILLLAAGVYLLWPLKHASWPDIVTATIAGAAALLDLALKTRARFL
jgi:hypothetical protein